MQIWLRSPSVVGTLAKMGAGVMVSARVNAGQVGHTGLDVPLVASATVLTAQQPDLRVERNRGGGLGFPVRSERQDFRATGAIRRYDRV